jgi:hypothetical protein
MATLPHSIQKLRRDFMYTIILKEEDMIKNHHFPIIALLNEAYNTDIIGFIHALNQRTGSGYNYSTCSFWNELDDNDKEHISRYDGILVESNDNEKVYLSINELLDYLVLLQNKISSIDKDLSDKIKILLKEYKTIYKDELQ